MTTKLVGPVYHDQVYTHDFAHASSWGQVGSLGLSAWTLEAPHGYALKLVSSEVKASVAVKVHSPLELWFQARRRFGQFGPVPPVAGGGAAYRVAYDSMRDWIRRGSGLPEVVAYPGSPELTQPVMLIKFAFSPAPILWSSIGADPMGLPKWNRLIIRIMDGKQYGDADGNQVEMALAKYGVEIYKEVEA